MGPRFAPSISRFALYLQCTSSYTRRWESCWGRPAAEQQQAIITAQSLAGSLSKRPSAFCQFRHGLKGLLAGLPAGLLSNYPTSIPLSPEVFHWSF